MKERKENGRKKRKRRCRTERKKNIKREIRKKDIEKQKDRQEETERKKQERRQFNGQKDQNTFTFKVFLKNPVCARVFSKIPFEKTRPVPGIIPGTGRDGTGRDSNSAYG